MTEDQFTEGLSNALADYLPGYETATKKGLLYALSVDENGKVSVDVDRNGEPVRGRGTVFQQDLLVFERCDQGDTSVIPRVVAEVKFGRVTTHDALTYSEKARRTRVIYPFVRYGLILGGLDSIPRRVLRLGQEFDFIVVVSHPTPPEEMDGLAKLFRGEIQSSEHLGLALSGQSKLKALVRSLQVAGR